MNPFARTPFVSSSLQHGWDKHNDWNTLHRKLSHQHPERGWTSTVQFFRFMIDETELACDLC